MAKDGTSRGGLRIGAGKKRKPLEEKILEGKAEESATVATFPVNKTPKEIPQLKKFMTARQKNGEHLQTKKIYSEMWNWLAERGCEKLVDNQLLEQYSMAVARWQQCEEYISRCGLLGEHPTTGGEIVSVYVKMAQDWQKQINQLRYQIYAAVRDNSTGVAVNDQNDLMEGLLRRVK